MTSTMVFFRAEAFVFFGWLDALFDGRGGEELKRDDEDDDCEVVDARRRSA